MTMGIFSSVGLTGAGLLFFCGDNAEAATPGLPFTENFASDNLKDPGTTATWSTAQRQVYLAWRKAQRNVFGQDTTGTDITADGHLTVAIALGDMDGDGDLDVVAGNYFGQANRLYLNNGTATPFNGVTGTNITDDAQASVAIALGDVDGDGDLDVVAGNYNQANRLYLNNGTANPFNGVTGADITADADDSYAIALGDVDGDGDLDVVAGNYAQPNRLYLNNGSADPFSGVTGTDITADAHQTHAIVLGDVDGDGDLDVVAGNSSVDVNRLYLNNGTADPFSGVTGTDITADAHETYAIALGDVDGDGDLDMVTGNWYQANRLYLNNGTSDPFGGVTGTNITADVRYTQSIALGDVDGDGDLDVVAGNYNQANRLYLNNGTANPFSGVTGTDITTDGHATFAIALGDVDGDGDVDVVAGNSNLQANRLYLNNGNSDPFSGVSGADITADADQTISIALGDVDGDGDLDVVAGNYYQANRLYLNNGTSDPFSGVSGTDITSDINHTHAMALGDVNGDGRLDVVAGNVSLANRLYLNNGTADPFNGVSGTDITADADATFAIALGDVNGDGRLDAVAGNQGQANRLYLNNGTATPFSGVTGADITPDSRQTYAVVLGDVDGDGNLDVVAGNYNQANRLYLNNGTAAPFSGVTGTDISADTRLTVAMALGDVNGDGHLDMVAGNSAQANRLYLNNGTAAPFSGVTGTDITADAHQTVAIELGDVDGDGCLDVVVGNNGVNRLYLNNGTTNPFSAVIGTDITVDDYYTRGLALGDVDGDGHLDVVAGNDGQANRLYLNNGTAAPFNGVTGTNITADAHDTFAIALGDVDGDGDLDVVAGNYHGQTNRLYLNNGTSNPFGGVSGTDITTDAQDTLAIALGDVDGDGDLDVVVGNYNGQTNRLYLNNGTADPFGGVSGTDITADAYETYDIALGDFNGDGHLDVVAGSYGQQNRLYLNNGTADPFGGVSGTDITVEVHYTYAIALGDVDGDGDLDVVAGNNTQVNRLYLNNGTANPFSGVSGSDITTDADGTYDIALGDVDGDGDLDVVAGNYNQANRLYLNNGTAPPFNGVTGTNITDDAHQTAAIALGDVDGDGDLDVVAGNYGQTNRLYLNNGTANPFSGATGTEITTDAHLTFDLALGDVDGDGDLDMVAGNNTQVNRLYRRELYQISRGMVSSLGVDAAAGAITNARLTATVTTPPNTWVDWYLTNNGGQQWFQVSAGENFFFPTTGSDLRWKTQLHSLSPLRSPVISQVVITVSASYVLWANSSTGQAIRWKVDPASGSMTGYDWISPPTGVAAGWQASSYAEVDATTGYVLWTNGSLGQAILWTVDPSAVSAGPTPTITRTAYAFVGPASGVGAGWQASSYVHVDASTGYVLWTNSGRGQAILWKVDPGTVSGGPTPTISYTAYTFVGPSSGVGAGWQASSYAHVDASTGYVLWTNSGTGQAILWKIDPATGAWSSWSWVPSSVGVGAGWQASSYTYLDASTGYVLWTNGSKGQAIRWKINPGTGAWSSWGWISASSGVGAGWQATSYQANERIGSPFGDAVPAEGASGIGVFERE